MRKCAHLVIILLLLIAIPIGFDYVGCSIEIFQGSELSYDGTHIIAISDETMLPCTISRNGLISFDGYHVHELKSFAADTLGRDWITVKHVFVFQLTDEEFKSITKNGYVTVIYSNDFRHRVSLYDIPSMP